MKKSIYFSVLIAALLITVSCRKKPLDEIIRPVKVLQVGSAGRLEKLFPATAEAEEYAYLTFRAGGMLQELAVEEGQNVKAGQLIASLDPRDFKLRVSSTKAAYEQAASQLERYKRLYEHQAVSKQDYEITVSKYENDKASYNQALNDMKDTRLLAPFAGNIEKKFVENHQEVQAGERIVKLNNLSKIQYRVTLPETSARLNLMSLNYGIELDADRGTFYKARVREVVASSVGGSGIPILLVIDDPAFEAKKLNILPGFTSNVKVETPGKTNESIEIPLACIYSDPKTGAKSVWKVDPQSSTVRLSPVQVGELTGGSYILILDGLKEGDLIATAGINLLADGEKVKIMKP